MKVEMGFCPVKCKVLEMNGCIFVDPANYKNELYTYTFITGDFDLSSIELKSSLDKVQNRINGKVDLDYVSRFVLSMEDGFKFSAPVLFKDGFGKYLVADGIHTIHALQKREVEKINGVFVFSHPNPCEVASLFNSRTNGNSEPMNETLQKAANAYFKDQNSGNFYSAKSYAKKFAIPEDMFNKYLRAAKIKEKLAGAGIASDKIKDPVLEQISRLDQIDESAALQLGKAVADYPVTLLETRKAVDDYLDKTNSMEKKKKSFEEHLLSFKISTDNGQKKRRRNVTKEQKLKEWATKGSNLFDKIDMNKLKMLMKDSSFSQALFKIQKCLSKLK